MTDFYWCSKFGRFARSWNLHLSLHPVQLFWLNFIEKLCFWSKFQCCTQHHCKELTSTFRDLLSMALYLPFQSSTRYLELCQTHIPTISSWSPTMLEWLCSPSNLLISRLSWKPFHRISKWFQNQHQGDTSVTFLHLSFCAIMPDALYPLSFGKISPYLTWFSASISQIRWFNILSNKVLRIIVGTSWFVSNARIFRNPKFLTLSEHALAFARRRSPKDNGLSIEHLGELDP